MRGKVKTSWLQGGQQCPMKGGQENRRAKVHRPMKATLLMVGCWTFSRCSPRPSAFLKEGKPARLYHTQAEFSPTLPAGSAFKSAESASVLVWSCSRTDSTQRSLASGVWGAIALVIPSQIERCCDNRTGNESIPTRVPTARHYRTSALARTTAGSACNVNKSSVGSLRSGHQNAWPSG